MSDAQQRVADQLVSLGFDPLISIEAARRHGDNINNAIDFASSEDARRWLAREAQIEQQRRQEAELHEEMAAHTLKQLQKLNRYPPQWCAAAVKILDPTPQRCTEWIEQHRSTLEQALPTATTLAQQRRALVAESVRVPTLGGIRRTPSEEFGYSRAIVKDDDGRKKKGRIQFRHSVTGRDLTPLKMASGYLKKKGSTGTYSWRFCVLNNEYFNYYSSKRAYQLRKSPTGSYSLLTIQSVEHKGLQIIIRFKQATVLAQKKRFMRKKFKAKKLEIAIGWVHALRSRMAWFQGLRNADESAIALRELIKYSMPPLTNFNLPVHAVGRAVIVDGPVIYKTKDGWDNGTVFLGPVVTVGDAGVYKWSFRTQIGAVVTLGVASVFADVNKLLNRSPVGWGFYLNNGNKGNGGEAKTGYTMPVQTVGAYAPSVISGQGPSWRGGSLVSVVLDTSGQGTFSIEVDGMSQGIAYSGLNKRAQAFVCGVSLCRQGDCVSVEGFPAPSLGDLGLDDAVQHAMAMEASAVYHNEQELTGPRPPPGHPPRGQRHRAQPSLPPPGTDGSPSGLSPFLRLAAGGAQGGGGAAKPDVSPERFQFDFVEQGLTGDHAVLTPKRTSSPPSFYTSSESESDSDLPDAPPRGKRRPPPLPTSRPPPSVTKLNQLAVGSAGAGVFARGLVDGAENEAEGALSAVAAAAARKSPPPPPPLPSATGTGVTAPYVVTSETNVFNSIDFEGEPIGHLAAGREINVAGIRLNHSGVSVARVVSVKRGERVIEASGFVPLEALNAGAIEGNTRRFSGASFGAAAAAALAFSGSPSRALSQHQSPRLSFRAAGATVVAATPVRHTPGRRLSSTHNSPAAGRTVAAVLNSGGRTRYISPQVAQLSSAKQAARASAARRLSSSAMGGSPAVVGSGGGRRLSASEQIRLNTATASATNSPVLSKASGGRLLMLRQKAPRHVDDVAPEQHVNVSDDGGSASESEPDNDVDVDGGASSSPRDAGANIFAAEDKDLSQWAQGEAPDEWDRSRMRRVRGLVRTNSGRYVRPEDTSGENQGGHIFWDQIKRNKRRQERRERRALEKAMKGKVRASKN